MFRRVCVAQIIELHLDFLRRAHRDVLIANGCECTPMGRGNFSTAKERRERKGFFVAAIHDRGGTGDEYIEVAKKTKGRGNG